MLGFTWRPSPCPTSQAIAAMKCALSKGANFWNGGDFYGTKQYNSMHLLQQYFEKYPEDAEKVVISIKGGLDVSEKGMNIDGSEKGIRRSVDYCLKMLEGTGKTLDIYECCRVDPKVEIEETVGTLKKYVDEGKLGGISLSEVDEEHIRRAAKVAKIDAVEVEVSLWDTRVLHNGVATACKELGIPIVAYSPLGKGFLTGQFKSHEDLPKDSMLRSFPRFQPENFQKNFELVRKLEGIAKKVDCTPAQLAIAWVRQLSDKPGMPLFIPIPGATTEERVKENTTEVRLEAEDMKEIDRVLSEVEIVGDRYPKH